MGSPDKILRFIEENLEYIPGTGELVWLKDRANGKIKAGSVAGSLNRGYRQIRIYGKWYKAHRLVWLLKTGSWPSYQIDHINRVKLDNRFENLRDVSNYQNCLNKVSDRELPVGVSYDRKNKKWVAQTYLHGVAKNLGRFSSVGDAKRAYLEANKGRMYE